MRALLCHAFGDPPDLAMGEVADPAPGRGEVLIQVEAVGLGFFDALLLAGRYQERPPLPVIPGRELAGRVLAVGEGADPALTGLRVAALAFGGALADRAVATAEHCLVVPLAMEPATAGGLLSAYATSLYALEVQGRSRPPPSTWRRRWVRASPRRRPRPKSASAAGAAAPTW